MIDIKLGKYRIHHIDEKNLVLAKEHIVSDRKSKRYGEKTEKMIGYYSSLKSAVNAYTREEIASPDYELKTVEEIRSFIDDLVKKIEEAAGRIENASKEA